MTAEPYRESPLPAAGLERTIALVEPTEEEYAAHWNARATRLGALSLSNCIGKRLADVGRHHEIYRFASEDLRNDLLCAIATAYYIRDQDSEIQEIIEDEENPYNIKAMARMIDEIRTNDPVHPHFYEKIVRGDEEMWDIERGLKLELHREQNVAPKILLKYAEIGTGNDVDCYLIGQGMKRREAVVHTLRDLIAVNIAEGEIAEACKFLEELKAQPRYEQHLSGEDLSLLNYFGENAETLTPHIGSPCWITDRVGSKRRRGRHSSKLQSTFLDLFGYVTSTWGIIKGGPAVYNGAIAAAQSQGTPIIMLATAGNPTEALNIYHAAKPYITVGMERAKRKAVKYAFMLEHKLEQYLDTRKDLKAAPVFDADKLY